MSILVEAYKRAVSDIEMFSNRIRPTAERFFDFIQNSDIDGYLDVSLPKKGSTGWLPFNYYHLKIQEDAATLDGVYFEAEGCDDDGERVFYHFVVPYGYIENPDVWQDRFTERIAAEQKAAIRAFHKMFPNIRKYCVAGEFQISVAPADPLLNDDYLSYKACPNVNGYYFEYEGVIYNSTHLYYRISTGEIYYIRDYMDRVRMLEGKWYPPLLKPLNAEARDAEIEANNENLLRTKRELDMKTLVSFAEKVAEKKRKRKE